MTATKAKEKEILSSRETALFLDDLKNFYYDTKN